MRELIVTEYVTLDGVVEAPGGEPGHPHTGWVFDYADEDHNDFKFGEVQEAGAHLLGRVTYESFAESWPQREGPFADKINSMPKYVVTTTIEEPEWESTTPISGDVAAEVARLKDEDGDPILVAGSGTLVHFLLAHDLVDELRLMVFPVAVGSGARLFPDSEDKLTFELAETRTFESGVQVQAYRPAGRTEPG